MTNILMRTELLTTQEQIQSFKQLILLSASTKIINMPYSPSLSSGQDFDPLNKLLLQGLPETSSLDNINEDLINALDLLKINLVKNDIFPRLNDQVTIKVKVYRPNVFMLLKAIEFIDMIIKSNSNRSLPALAERNNGKKLSNKNIINNETFFRK